MESTQHQWAVKIMIPVTAEQARTVTAGGMMTLPDNVRATVEEIFCAAHGSPGDSPCRYPFPQA